tara:strand:+ start:409 stop:744 length:336 start_codon:yes stop_codon:yes gene_type:complete
MTTHDMNTTQYQFGVPHPNNLCERCGFIDRDQHPTEHLLALIIDDAYHWGVDSPETKLKSFGPVAMIIANRVVTDLAVKGDLAKIRNIPGYYVSTAQNFHQSAEDFRRPTN